MRYDLTKPCSNCPFRKGPKAVRLTRERAEEIASTDSTFQCHKTTVNGGADGKNPQHCAGALLFWEKTGHNNQMVRIAGRLGMYDPDKLDRSCMSEVVDSPDEMEFGN